MTLWDQWANSPQVAVIAQVIPRRSCTMNTTDPVEERIQAASAEAVSQTKKQSNDQLRATIAQYDEQAMSKSEEKICTDVGSQSMVTELRPGFDWICSRHYRCPRRALRSAPRVEISFKSMIRNAHVNALPPLLKSRRLISRRSLSTVCGHLSISQKNKCH